MSIAFKLYEIAEEYENLLESAVNPETGEIETTALDTLSNVSELAEKKVIAVASYIKNIQAEAAAIEDAKKAMADRERRLKSAATSLMDYLKFNMERCGIKKIESSPFFKIALKDNPPSVSIDDMELIPDEYIKTKTEIVVDKLKLAKDLKDGLKIPGASLKRGTSLTIK